MYRLRRKGNTETVLKDCTVLYWLRIEPTAAPCENSSRKGGKFMDQLSDFQLTT